MDQNERLKSPDFRDHSRQNDITEIICSQIRNADDADNIRDPYISKFKNQY